MNGSATPKRDSPDNEDFEGEAGESGQQGEEAPKEVAHPKDDEREAEKGGEKAGG